MIGRRSNGRWLLASPPMLIVAVVGLVLVAVVIGMASLPGNDADATAAANEGGCGSVTTGTDPSALNASMSGTASTASASAGPGPTSTAAQSAAGSASSTGTATTPANLLGTDPAHLAGITLTPAQVQQAQTIVGVGKGLNTGAREVAVALAVSYLESKFDPSASVANGLGQGLFLETSDAYPGVVRTDPAGSAVAFFTHIANFEKTGVFKSDEPFDNMAYAMSIQGVGSYTTGDYVEIEAWATTLQTLLASGLNPSGTGSSAITCTGAASDNVGWDPGNIITDQVFYNTAAMNADAIRTFIGMQNAPCDAGNSWCLRNLRITDPGQPANTYCAAVPGGTNESAATLIAAYSTACGVNPQVMLTKLQLESQALNRSDPTAGSYDAAWGWNCPDSGPGGSANCDPAHAGFLNQLVGMARSWAEMKVDIPTHKYNYAVGTYNILWNVEETGCGSAPIDIKNVATASLYVYTPYQPNAASIAAYPGEGDKCSSYGNRNFFYMFRQYFGSTGGGAPIAGPAGGKVGGPITVNGVSVKLPANAGISATITAPNATVAKAISAGLSWIGTIYSWGGGSPTGPTLGICGPFGAENDCHIVGFDCSGLIMYMWAQVGITVDHFSQDIFNAGQQIPWDQKLPGDSIGYKGHITMYVGTWGGVDYMLEAPESSEDIRVTPVRDSSGDPHYANVSRLWASTK